MKSTIATLICIICFACSTDTDSADTSTGEVNSAGVPANAVPFEEARNYFVKNTFKTDSLANPKIVTQKDFDAVFGMASTMSARGRPTPIDFSKQYVIAVIQPVTDKATTLSVQDLVQKENDIILNYTKTQGEKQSFTTRPFLLLIVDNTYSGNVLTYRL